MSVRFHYDNKISGIIKGLFWLTVLYCPGNWSVSQQELVTEGGFSPTVAGKQRETNIPNEILKRNRKERKDMTDSGFQSQMNKKKRNKKCMTP